MHRLRVLGTARLEQDGAHVGGLAAQRHRLALLALLVAARDHRLPRERLMALLWPNHDTPQARHSLNVALHALRGHFGREALRSEGIDIQLDLSQITCDLVEFRRARREGDGDAVRDLYGGPFLDGFYLDGADEFSAWQEDERARIDAEFVDALLAFAERLEGAGEWRAAAEQWQVLWARDRAAARPTSRLMRALEAAGDRTMALRVADEHQEHMEREFGEPGAREVLELAATLRATPGAALPALVAPSAPSPSSPAMPDRTPTPRPRRWRRAASALLVVTVLAFLANSARDRSTSAPTASVAVLPFVDMSPSGDQAYLGDGLTEEILNALTRIRGLHVASRSSAFQFRGDGVDVRAVGRALNVAAVVEGSVRQDGDRLRVTAQLIDARDGFHLWSAQYDRELRDVFALQEDIAREVAAALGSQLVVALPDTLVTPLTKVPEAYRQYLQGRYAWNSRTREGLFTARTAFEQAIALDPGFAAAYAGLSDTWQLLPDYGGVPAAEGLAQAKTFALRAIALDSTMAAAYASLGAVLDDYDRDRDGAEAAYQRALALDPEYATAAQWLALHHANRGRRSESLQLIERARRLDPLSRIINTSVGAVLYFAREYTAAAAEYRAVLTQDSSFATAVALLGRTLLVDGRVAEAVVELERAVTLAPEDESVLAVYAAALATAGARDSARRIVARLRDVGPNDYVPYTELASAYAALGQADDALASIDAAFDARDPALKHIKVEPLYDALRGDVRFADLVRAAGYVP